MHHIAICVQDLGRSIDFYKEIFGFEEVQRFEREDLKGRAVFLKLGDFHLEIWEFDDASDPKDDLSNLKIRGIRHMAFSVKNVDEVYESLHTQYQISQPQLGGSGRRYCFLKDPDGIMIEFYYAA